MLAGWRGQSTADVWIERVIDLIGAHKPLAWFGEAGVIAKTIEPMLRRRLTERGLGARLEWLPSIADKPTRARGFQARAAMGKVHLPSDLDGDVCLDEYLRFPAGKHDDEVDAASLIGRALDQMHPAIATVTTVNPNPVDSFRRRERDDSDWRTA
jgi:predicted phage terminase large subunit-like protein